MSESYLPLSPLPIKPTLAPNPAAEPQLFVEVLSAQGRKLKLADPKATRALVALMDMQAVLGGAASHWGGPSAFAELMSAAHGLMFDMANAAKTQWHEAFNFVNDAGHCENGLYALKANYKMAGLNFDSLKGFRSITSPLTGHGEAHLFPQGVMISNGPLGSALPQSQGLAHADALSGKWNRVTLTAISDGACMEGEAKESFAAIPGLAAKGKLAPFVLIISDNNTKLSGRIDKDSFSMNPTFAAMRELGWKVLDLPNGHDLKACVDTLESALQMATANPKQPIAIHAKTIKGFGVKATETSASGGHGFPLKKPEELTAFIAEIYNGSTIPDYYAKWTQEMIEQVAAKKAKASSAPTTPEEKIQVGIAQAMIKMREKGLPVISVTSDLPGSTGVADFHKKFPDSSIDIGVAEANMISHAGGLSRQGFIPIVDTFAQFGVTKGALPLTMCALSQAPIIAVFSHTGFQDAADGASHQALSYFSQVASIPHTETYALTCSEEAASLMEQAIQRFVDMRARGEVPPHTIFFLGRENFPRNFNNSAKYQLGKAQIVLDASSSFKKSVALVAAGSLMPQAILAAKKLNESGVGAVVVNPSLLNKPDLETIGRAVAACDGRVVMAEDHQWIAGMSAVLSHALIENGQALKLKTLAVHGEFGQSAYNAIDLYKRHQLDSDAMVKSARLLCE